MRQAVIRVKPDYFALPETERENYRLHMNTEDEFRINENGPYDCQDLIPG